MTEQFNKSQQEISEYKSKLRKKTTESIINLGFNPAQAEMDDLKKKNKRYQEQRSEAERNVQKLKTKVKEMEDQLKESARAPKETTDANKELSKSVVDPLEVKNLKAKIHSTANMLSEKRVLYDTLKDWVFRTHKIKTPTTKELKEFAKIYNNERKPAKVPTEEATGSAEQDQAVQELIDLWDPLKLKTPSDRLDRTPLTLQKTNGMMRRTIPKSKGPQHLTNQWKVWKLQL